MMYQNNPKIGGGTIISIDEIWKNGNKFRLDYGMHNSTKAYWHWHGRIRINDVMYGSTNNARRIRLRPEFLFFLLNSDNQNK